MQIELFNEKNWRTRIELANAIFEIFEIFNFRQLKHSKLARFHPSNVKSKCNNNPPKINKKKVTKLGAGQTVEPKEVENSDRISECNIRIH